MGIKSMFFFVLVISSRRRLDEAVLSSQQESDLRDGAAFGRDIRPFFRRAAKQEEGDKWI